jgi:hypothetical protein
MASAVSSRICWARGRFFEAIHGPHPISIFKTKTSTEIVTEKTERKEDEIAFEIERCGHHRAGRTGLHSNGDAGVSV